MARFGDVLSLGDVANGEAPEAELRNERDGGFEDAFPTILGAHSFLGGGFRTATHDFSFLYLLSYSRGRGNR